MTTTHIAVQRLTRHLGRKPRILWDLDGTLFDWGQEWDATLERRFAHLARIPRSHEQLSFNLNLGLNDEERHAVSEIMADPGFYARLEPFPGAVEAAKQASAYGFENFIATSPWWPNPSCLQDKADSVAKHLGEDWLPRLILGSPKWVIAGDILVDDRPDIEHSDIAPWSQVLYDQPYNQNSPLPRIRDWGDWFDTTMSVFEERLAA